MDRRFTTFMVTALAVLVINQIVYSLFFAPPPPPPGAKPAVADAKKQPADAEKKQPVDDANAVEAAPAVAQAPEADKAPPADDPAAPPADKEVAAAPTVEERLVALGSADTQSPFRMLVYVNNRGAAIERLEMNSPRYHELDDRSGELGYLALVDAPAGKGALVRVVGPGTPAAAAGLEPGDVVTNIADQLAGSLSKLGNLPIRSAADLVDALQKTKPGETVELAVRRNDAEQKLTATLARRPLAVIRPEWESKPVEAGTQHDPLSFLLSIQSFDDESTAAEQDELKSSDLRTANWEIASTDDRSVSLKRTLPKLGLSVTKTYRLEQVPSEQANDADYPAYGLTLEVSIANVGDKAHSVAYRLDGPNGLPTEGAWYANKVSRTWGAAGLRDIVARFEGGATTMITCPTIADKDFNTVWGKSPLDYSAVDAQYFACALIPQKANPNDAWFAEVRPRAVGAIPTDKNNLKLTNVSFTCTSVVEELAPGGAPLEHHFQIFAGPKKPTLLAQYVAPNTTVTLSDLVYYGWFGVVAKPMLALLHAFHAVVSNYGVAIIMLTVLVRGCMFPLSRKQAISSQKMQLLQPEMKRLNEKYKNEPEKKMKAQQQLYREHNFNPLGGCLLAFVQLPIFVGLYRSLSVDVELRQAPLFGEGIRWASNLAAPDMFWDWSHLVPDFVSHGTGFFALGPYLNILPLITIGLFIWQQKMFMPPPADEQAALQQKMMQYMMIFMGIMFFKVASGLCVYFIASSIWGIAERKLLPKTVPAAAGANGAVTVSPAASENGAAAKKKRQKGRR